MDIRAKIRAVTGKGDNVSRGIGRGRWGVNTDLYTWLSRGNSNQTVWVWIQALLLVGCMTMGKSLDLSCQVAGRSMICLIPSITGIFLKSMAGNSLEVQWLRLHTPNARGPGLIPVWETKSHIPQLRVCMLQLKITHSATKTHHSQIKQNDVLLSKSQQFTGGNKSSELVVKDR